MHCVWLGACDESVKAFALFYVALVTSIIGVVNSIVLLLNKKHCLVDMFILETLSQLSLRLSFPSLWLAEQLTCRQGLLKLNCNLCCCIECVYYDSVKKILKNVTNFGKHLNDWIRFVIEI